ncbi:hypothetical protein FA15DRAFT_754931 [Coprinopsis marcescibilis]|uniref:Required for respiratory growth protein 9, mitochondrial n=1 Tax=Coprinopsis marcescibilis TaxID=230819 RepID=A0A5C3L0Y4_COPMA|nr:hypothetical protein FA15DRAFT_754931 [Coprinopsis marcescibilis]
MASLFSNIFNVRGLCMRGQLSSLYSSRGTLRHFGTPAARRPRSILDDDNADVDLSEDSELVDGARPGTAPAHLRRPAETSTPMEWRRHRESIKQQFPDGWSPPRKISREAMHGIRQLNKLEPEKFTTSLLADKFRISPEAVRRILKSRWEPSKERREKMVAKERKERAEKMLQSRIKEREEAAPAIEQLRPKEPFRRPKNDRLTLQ